jgi:hypothetical protein
MGPGAIAPQAPIKRSAPIQRSQPTREIQPGDLICGSCGEGNAPTRKFCSRCGTTLQEAVIATAPWWRKFIPKRKPKTLAAGERPWGGPTTPGGKKPGKKFSLAKVMRPLSRIAGIVLLVATIAFGVSSPFRDAVTKRVTSVKDALISKVKPEYLQVHPLNSKASSELKDNPGPLAVDGFKNTFWIAPANDPQPILAVTFDESVPIDKLIAHNGRPDNYQSTNRPQVLHLVFSNGQSADVTLKDDPNEHTYGVNSHGKVSSVEIHILQVYKAFNPSGTALTEIEFFRKK